MPNGFDAALQHMRLDSSASRACWAGYVVYIKDGADERGLPCRRLTMVSPGGSEHSWLASNGDLLADDWQLL